MSEGTAQSSTESSSAAAASAVDLELKLGNTGSSSSDPAASKRASPSPSDPDPTSGPTGLPRSPRSPDAAPARKKMLVGWPPVPKTWQKAVSAKFVKVAVAGAPYQRKVDLEAYAGYKQLLAALQDKFTSNFTVRRVGNEEMKLVDVVSGTEYVPTYEDKDGDWMLVGDVPWRMFVETCQRLRLMKSSEAVNLSPRASQ